MDRIFTRTHAKLLHFHVVSEVYRPMKSQPEVSDSHSRTYEKYYFLRYETEEINSLISKIQFHTNFNFLVPIRYLFLILGGGLKTFRTANKLINYHKKNLQHKKRDTVHSMTKGTFFPLLFC
jgi:hypothetical protein